jgi:hypothetical protein
MEFCSWSASLCCSSRMRVAETEDFLELVATPNLGRNVLLQVVDGLFSLRTSWTICKSVKSGSSSLRGAVFFCHHFILHKDYNHCMDNIQNWIILYCANMKYFLHMHFLLQHS